MDNIDLRLKLGLLNPEEMQNKLDLENLKAFELLDDLKANRSVCRWDCYRARHDIRRIMSTTDIYDDIRYEMEDLINSAKESL